MALMNFLKPKNKLEEGGRCSVPVMQDEGERSRNVRTATGKFL